MHYIVLKCIYIISNVYAVYKTHFYFKFLYHLMTVRNIHLFLCNMTVFSAFIFNLLFMYIYIFYIYIVLYYTSILLTA